MMGAFILGLCWESFQLINVEEWDWVSNFRESRRMI